MRKNLKKIKTTGIILAAAGLICIAVKGLLPEYIDGTGILHEAFFLLPVGFALAFAGIVILLAAALLRRRNGRKDA